MLGRTDRRLRLVVLLAAFLIGAASLGARLTYWQVVRGAHLQELALSQLETRTEEPLPRGEILDRTGNVVLATNAYRDLLAAYPSQIPEAEREVVARRVARVLGLEGRSAQRVADALKTGGSYVVLATQLSESQSDAVRSGIERGTLQGVKLEPRPIRLYPSPGGAPDSTLASHLLGFVNSEGKGQYGIEQRYQELLAGKPRVLAALRDVAGRSIAGGNRLADPGTEGANLRLTIDASLQLRVEKELYAAWVNDGSVSASAIVIDPDNGAILAWGTVPGYDANRYRAVAKTDPARFVDPNASLVYEPGSVMKMLTAAAAYERDVVRPDSLVDDTGKLQLGEDRVDDSDKRAMGWLSFEDVIAYSRNVGAAKVALMLDRDTKSSSIALHDMWAKLGIGQRTGVDVAGEVNGIVTDPQKRAWPDIDLANASFGQGVGVTPVQLAVAFSAMVNGGYRVQPHVVSAIGKEDLVPTEPAPVLSGELSAELRRLMVHVVNEVPQYAQGTLIPRYVVGGKTGTAQIWNPKRNDWEPDIFNFSFVGFVGQTGPDAVIAVQIHRAKPLIRGQGDFHLGITSYELFRRVAVDTIGALDIPPGDAAKSAVVAGP
jgi:cell division protein FtsI (penicillin-binding protein 3)